MKIAGVVPRNTVWVGVTAYLFLLVAGGQVPAQERRGDVGNREDAENARVYVMTGEETGNMVAVLNRAADGTLTRVQTVSTGGVGSGPGIRPANFGTGPGPDPLNSSDALVKTEDGRFLLVVNPRSNDVSVLAITEDGLKLVDRVPSGGVFPVSLTTHGSLVYVVNQGQSPTNRIIGEPPSISGFVLGPRGRLHPIPNSTRVIGQVGAAPGEIAFDPEGELLLVAETLGDRIDIFPLKEDGLLGAEVSIPSNKRTPLGIVFTHRRIMAITEGNILAPLTGTPNGGTVSSYRLTDDGGLQPVSVAVPNGQTATCWLRFSRNGRFAFAGNKGSGAVSSYRVSPDGKLSLLASNAGDVGGPFSVPTDMDVTADGKYLYVYGSLIGTIQGYRIEEDGSLTHVSSLSGFPLSTQGMVAH